MEEQIRDLRTRIIIIRLLKSIGVGIIVATIVAVINVLAFQGRTFSSLSFQKFNLFVVSLAQINSNAYDN